MSALIFVALAVAWAAYLIPKALRHHEDVVANRTVEGFSDRLRVLARREPDGRSRSHLVVPGRPADTVESSAAPESPAAAAPAPAPARTAAAAVAARRRLRVVLAIVALAVVVVALAAFGVVGWSLVAVPAVLLVAWLVACRVMVTKERAVRISAPARRSAPAAATEAPAAAGPQSFDLDDLDGLDDPITEEVPAVAATDQPAEPVAAQRADGSWDPVPVTLPTYVAKAPAPRRSVSTIDLDSTGVWTSGASASDSALAREAEEAERAAKVHAVAEAARRRASGS